MGKDYYSVLGVSRGCDEAAIKKAYKKMALKYHPDRCQSSGLDPKVAEEMFKEVGEAYAVLSDSDKRAVYDKYGEEGLKAGGGPGAGFQGGGFPGGAGGGGFHGFSQADAQNIFEQFFGSMGGGMGGGSGMGGFAHMFGGGGGGGGGGRRSPFGGGSPFGGHSQPQQDAAIEHDVGVSLEELYAGTTKTLRMTRQVLNPDGRSTREEQMELKIPIRAGLKAGSKITYERHGNERPGAIPADIVFVIREKPHHSFKRQDDNLIYEHRLYLKQALCGADIGVKTLDGRRLNVHLDGPVAPGHRHVVQGEGMPKRGGGRGNLIIRVDVVFPTSLTPQQKAQLSTIL